MALSSGMMTDLGTNPHYTDLAVLITVGATVRGQCSAGGETVSGTVCGRTAGFSVVGDIEYGDEALSQFTLQFPDVYGDLTAAHRDHSLMGSKVELWLLTKDDENDAYNSEQIWVGKVNEVLAIGNGVVSMTAGTGVSIGSHIVPPRFSVYCRWKTTTQCSYRATCAGTIQACVANGQQANFGGQPFLLPSGFRIEFRDNGETYSGDNSGGGRGIVYVRRGV